MAPKTVVKSEPADRSAYSALVVNEMEREEAVRSTIEAGDSHIKQETLDNEVDVKSEFQGFEDDDPQPVPYPGWMAQAESRKRGRSKHRASPPPVGKKRKTNHEIIDISEGDQIAEAWEMARDSRAPAVATKLRRLETYKEKEVKKLEIDMNPQWYRPDTFFSRPERRSTRINPDVDSSWFHPATRDGGANYRRSERRLQKYMAETYGSSRIGKVTKQTKTSSTVSKKLTEETVHESIAKGTAQFVKTKAGDKIWLDDGSYCICGEEKDGVAIQCSNKDCKQGWYHLECAGLQEAPKGKWTCLICKMPKTDTSHEDASNNSSRKGSKKPSKEANHKLAQDVDQDTDTPTTPHRQKRPSARSTVARKVGGSRLNRLLGSKDRPRPATGSPLVIRSRGKVRSA